MSIRRTEKWPREYAADIIKLKTREERIAVLQRVPENYRAATETHVKNYFEIRQARRKHKSFESDPA